MTLKIKIHGAGSIGNHLSNASRLLGWDVDLCDIDAKSLERTQMQIYPSRYGKWDESIQLFKSDIAPKGGYDMIFIGTPPDVHIQLALEALEERPKAILIEKPVCCPDLAGADKLYKRAKELGIPIFVGYDHVVGKASKLFTQKAMESSLGKVNTLDVEFREHWGGIFNAHPWLSGPEDTYLGYSRRGGGASGEHSHAANLWQHFAHELGLGRVVEVQAMMDFVEDGDVLYDSLCIMNLRTEKGLIGRCVQDVVVHPPRKWARIQHTNGHVEWQCGKEPGIDVVNAFLPGNIKSEQRVSKTRADDFVEELSHIHEALSGDLSASPISLEKGLDTMLLIAACNLSHETGRKIHIDYSQGYTMEAFSID